MAGQVLTVGDTAPDFSLVDQNNRPVSLRDFRGKNHVVLAFYPLDFSPVCSLELPRLQQNYEAFRQADAEVLGISIDSRWSHAAFVEKLGLSYRLLSDFDRKAAQAYGVLRQEGFAERSLFLVDKEGRIRYAAVFEIGTVPDITPLQKALAAL
ncbi:MAG: redoxin domain-containing protein [Chloroflexota bacterium]